MREESRGTRLGPGDDIQCEECGVHSTTVEHRNWRVCGCCGVKVQEYDAVDLDRVQLDAEGRMSGRGGRVKLGAPLPGSVIGSSSGRWGYLSRIDRSCGNAGPSRSKKECISLILRYAVTDSQRDRALDLLDVGWPNLDGTGKRQADIGSRGRGDNSPIWKASHPRGVGSSAAVCLHLASQGMGFDSKFSDWIDLCMPDTRGARTYAYRALKRMRVILGRDGKRKGSGDAAREILARANLGNTIYAQISNRIRKEWVHIIGSGDNLENHPRPVLAALCHVIAKEEGLKISNRLIMSRFNVGRGYLNWIPRVLDHSDWLCFSHAQIP